MTRWTLSLLVLLPAFGCSRPNPVRRANLSPETKAVRFLSREVPAWSRENGCFSCHNNGDGARALYAAARRGFPVPARALADTTAWITHPARWDLNKGDPGFSDKRLANLQFAGSLLAALETGTIGAHDADRAALEEAARRVASDQGPDGTWPIELQNPVGSPATYGTALSTFLGWRVLRRAGLPETAGAAHRAEAWLRALTPDNIITGATLLLAASEWPRGRETLASAVEASYGLLRRGQTREGGWGPYADTPAEAFDTALALLALARHRDRAGSGAMIRRGRGHLLAQQQVDGGWPATTRPSGGESYAQRISTTGWVLLALLETSER